MKEKLDPSQDASPPVTARSILDAYRPTNEPVVVTLPGGETMSFRPVCHTDARDRLIAEASQFIALIPKRGTIEFANFPCSDVIPTDERKIALSFMLHRRSIEPELSQRDAFELHQAPELIEFIERRLDLADKSISALTRQRVLIDLAKKSETTSGSAEGSSPASGTFPADSPTS